MNANKIKGWASLTVGLSCTACAFKPPIDRGASTLMVIVGLAVILNGIDKLLIHKSP